MKVVIGRAPVGDGGHNPKFPAGHVKLDLGIVPGAQQSTEISNWLQDEVIAVVNRAHLGDQVGDDTHCWLHCWRHSRRH
jgi:hypothetical protein